MVNPDEQHPISPLTLINAKYLPNNLVSLAIFQPIEGKPYKSYPSLQESNQKLASDCLLSLVE